MPGFQPFLLLRSGGNAMTTAKLLGLTLLGSASLIVTAASAEHVRQGAKIFPATLTGAAECNAGGTCNLGDPDGTGTVTFFINPGQKRICYELTVAQIVVPTAAHIHKAPAGVSGPIFVGFPTPPLGSSEGCVDVTSRQAAAIISKPSQYYFNVHNADFQAGAIRGQLSKKAAH
jgi:hypothetical protein